MAAITENEEGIRELTEEESEQVAGGMMNMMTAMRIDAHLDMTNMQPRLDAFLDMKFMV
jgi:hypothetical protein